MSTLKKRQHYVWRHYLHPWTSKGQLWCYLSSQNKYIKTNTRGIAQETFFYRTRRLSDADTKYLRLLIDRAKDRNLREIHEGTLRLFQLPFALQDQIEGLPLGDVLRSELEAHLLDAEKTMGEAFHTFLENRTARILSDLRQCKCDFYERNDDAMEFVNFIAQQFFRTPKLLQIMRRFSNPIPGLDFERTWFIESQIYATNVGWGVLAEKEHYNFEFLQNDSNSPFVTSDQPVLSLNGHENNDLKLYYSLSPSLALLFYKEIGGTKKSIRQVHQTEADYFNQRLYKGSCEQIYARNQEDLRQVVASANIATA